MFVQKLYKNGNSVAVTVPKESLHQLGLRDGSKVSWKKTEEGLLLVPHVSAQRRAQEIDPVVAKLIQKISKKYSKVWEDLSKI